MKTQEPSKKQRRFAMFGSPMALMILLASVGLWGAYRTFST